MYVLPLLKRELCVAVRRPMTRWLRLGAGGGAMGAAVWAILVWGSSVRFSGSILFYAIAAGAYLGALSAGFVRGLDAISLERRDDTLPLLFLTDLTAWDVLLGKMAAVITVPLLMLLSVFPALAMCQLVGGLTAWELWRTVFGLIVTLFFSASCTLLMSTIARQRRTVVLGAALLLLITIPFSFAFGVANSTGRF